jgi:transcriptional regulator with XRE-family HTH domain
MSKGLAQQRLALDAGVDRTVVSKIERGVTNPSLEILLRLDNHLNVDVGQLLLSPDE